MMWLEMLVVPLLTLELTDSPFLVSLVFFLRLVPMLFGFGGGGNFCHGGGCYDGGRTTFECK